MLSFTVYIYPAICVCNICVKLGIVEDDITRVTTNEGENESLLPTIIIEQTDPIVTMETKDKHGSTESLDSAYNDMIQCQLHEGSTLG